MHHLHREKLFKALEEETGIVYMSGAEVMHRFGTDYEYPFRQESNFLYLTNCDKPDFQLILDLRDKTYHLFSPKRDAQFAVWMGFVSSQDEIQEKYQPDFLHYDEDLETVLHKLKPEKVYCLDEDDAEYMADYDFETDDNLLKDALAFCRCQKTDWELNQMRAASRIASIAHVRAYQELEAGKFEYQIKGAYEYECVSRGLFHQPYGGIFAGGRGSAVLHYTENSRKLKDGDLFLIDAGAEYNGYAADITRTYGVNKKMSTLQADLYEVCLQALDKAIIQAEPGAKMEDLHIGAARDIIMGLKGLDLVKGNIDEMMDKNIFALFFPHGLGHFLGLDTHDVGGYPRGVEKIDRPGLKFLRARRTLEPGMAITIEPGLYFIPALLEPAFEDPEKSKYLNVDQLKKMLNFGGYRIEDNLIITEDGHENMTKVPKKLRDISK